MFPAACSRQRAERSQQDSLFLLLLLVTLLSARPILLCSQHTARSQLCILGFKRVLASWA